MTEHVNLILRAKTLIDGLGGAPISQGLVAIANDKIVYAGAAAHAPVFPPEAQTLDLSDACLLPGLIDMHSHPTFYWEEPDLATYTDDADGVSAYPPAMITLLAASNLRKALLSGVTTLRDTGSVNDIMFDVKRGAQKGLIPAPRLFVSGRLIIPTGGHCHNLAGLTNQADGPVEFRRAVREEIRAGADFIKLANDKQDLTQEELNAAVDEAHRLGKKVACHTIWAPSQRMAIEAGADTFEHGTPSPEEIDLAAKKGIAWTPTINMSVEYLKWYEQQSRHADPKTAEAARKGYANQSRYLEQKHASMEYALKAGLRIVTGTDSFMRDVRFDAVPDEIRRFVEYGCTPMQAIQAATLWAAQSMDWPDIGALQPGKVADIIAVSGDPLADNRAMDTIVMVMLEGKVANYQQTTTISRE
ncbi:MAG: amidohydrolase family protein [Chloroflexi bacterium]|nr:amidohydrolase family protein [Chloroflexota bacterium]